MSLVKVCGFVGTNAGLTESQLRLLKKQMESFAFDSAIHSGDIGDDEQFHQLCMASLTIKRVAVVPGMDVKKSGNCFAGPKNVIRQTAQNSEQDRVAMIVACSDMVFFAPNERREQLRDRVWYGIRLARLKKTSTSLLFP